MDLPADLDRVLAEDDWLRRLARRLVGDVHAADDLVQDAWVRALQTGRADRGWLFGVLRNLRREGARSERRRAELHATASAPAEAPAADDVVAELLLRKRVTEALLGLDEPFRTALYLRYVQDESLPAIARRTGVAVSTVHQRIARGLEKLRARLDDEYGGERRSWALGLLSLAKPPGLAAGLLGGVAVGVGTKIAGTIVLVGGALAWWWVGTGGAAVEGSAAAAPRAAASEGREADPEPDVLEPAPARREAVAAAPERTAPVAPAEPVATTLAGRVVDLDAAAVPDVDIAYRDDEQVFAKTDAGGRFRLPLREAGEREPTLRCLEPGYATLLPGVRSGDELVVVVGRTATFAGAVVDEAGDPIAGAKLRVDLQQSLFRDLGVSRPFVGSKPLRVLETDALGRFELADGCGGEHVGLWVEARGYRSRTVPLPGRGDPAMLVTLAGDDTRVLEGTVVDLSGVPVAGASVSAGMEIVLTGEDGAFRLSWRLEGSSNHVRGEDGVFRPEYYTSVIRAVRAGYQPAAASIDDLDPDEPLVLQLGPEALSIRGRVVDERGMPRAGAVVWPGGLTPFGTRFQDAAGARASWTVTVEQELSGTQGDPGVRADGEGRFALGGLLDRDYPLYVVDPASGMRAGPFPVRAGSGDVELLLATEPETARVAGRVTTLSGRPIADVWVVPRRESAFPGQEHTPFLPEIALGTRTDEEGRFEFPVLATRGTVLELQHESFFIRHFDLEGQADLDELVIAEAALCEVQVELAWDPTQADTVKVLDEEGEPLQLLESYGAFLGADVFVKLTAGKSGVFRTLETAATVVLLDEGVEVRREPVRLDPGERNLLRL